MVETFARPMLNDKVNVTVQTNIELLPWFIWTQWNELQRGSISYSGTPRQGSLSCRYFCCTFHNISNRLRDASLFHAGSQFLLSRCTAICRLRFHKQETKTFHGVDCTMTSVFIKTSSILHFSAGSRGFAAKLFGGEAII